MLSNVMIRASYKGKMLRINGYYMEYKRNDFASSGNPIRLNFIVAVSSSQAWIKKQKYFLTFPMATTMVKFSHIEPQILPKRCDISISLLGFQCRPLFLYLFSPSFTFVKICKVIAWENQNCKTWGKMLMVGLPIMGMGRATTRTPHIAHMAPITFPSGVVGAISPYPTYRVTQWY